MYGSEKVNTFSEGIDPRCKDQPAKHDYSPFLSVLFSRLNRTYWERNGCLNMKICKYLVSS